LIKPTCVLGVLGVLGVLCPGEIRPREVERMTIRECAPASRSLQTPTTVMVVVVVVEGVGRGRRRAMGATGPADVTGVVVWWGWGPLGRCNAVGK